MICMSITLKYSSYLMSEVLNITSKTKFKYIEAISMQFQPSWKYGNPFWNIC